MLYYKLRMMLWIIFSILIIFKIRKTNIVKKKLVIFVIIILCITLNYISLIFPVENLFVKFESVESVFNYVSSGTIESIVYGNESCMIYYSKGNGVWSYLFIPKFEDGYKIPGIFYTKRVFHKFDKDASIDIYNILGTDDYYIYGSTISYASEITILDSNNKPAEVSILEFDDGDPKIIVFHAFIEEFTNEYYLLINGDKLSIIQ